MLTASYVFWFLITLALVYFIRKLVHRKRILKLITKVPTFPNLPIFGHALYYNGPTGVIGGFQTLCKEIGPIFRITAFWKESVVLSDGEYAEAMLKSTEILHKSAEYEKVHKWLGMGLLTAGPTKWHQTRKILTPAFHFKILDEFIDVFSDCSDVLVSKLKEQSDSYSVNIYDYVSLCTLDIICETAMGTKVNAQIDSDSQYVMCVKQMSRIVSNKIFSPIKRIPLLYYFCNDYKVENDTLKLLHGYTNSVIRNRRQTIANKGDSTGSGKKRLAFLDLMMNSMLDGRPMTDDEIRQEVDTFMFEGHDTTSSAISSILYCLAYHRDIQDRAYEEIGSIFGSDKTRRCTQSDLQKMNYLEMVIKETLRLYPPVPLFGRIFDKDTQFGDYIIPEGVDAGLYTWGLHRQPAVFPDPEKFIPERFTLENQNQRNPFSYTPFSAGPRNCIGQRFAMLEMKSTVSKVLLNFEILPTRDFQPQWVLDMTLKSLNGIHVSLRRRETN